MWSGPDSLRCYLNSGTDFWNFPWKQKILLVPRKAVVWQLWRCYRQPSGQGLDTTPTPATSGSVVQHFCFSLPDCATDYRVFQTSGEDKSSTDLTDRPGTPGLFGLRCQPHQRLLTSLLSPLLAILHTGLHLGFLTKPHFVQAVICLEVSSLTLAQLATTHPSGLSCHSSFAAFPVSERAACPPVHTHTNPYLSFVALSRKTRAGLECSPRGGNATCL